MQNKIIHLSGYFNASNIGDDAICSVITNYFGCFIPEKLSDPANATIVGGGEYDSWMIEGVTNELYATGVGLVRDMVGKKRQAELTKFKQLWVRTYADYRLAKMYGLNPLQGADSAVLMSPTEDGFKDKVILIPSVHIAANDYPDYDISLPLNPSDNNLSSVELYNEPQKYLNALVGAKKVITYGRLHAHILSFIAGTKVEDMMPDNKVLAWSEMKENHTLYEMRLMVNRMLESVSEAIEKQ